MFSIVGKRPLRAAVLVLSGILTIASGYSSKAQSGLPESVIRIVVPYSPGGAGDVMARAIARTIGQTLNRTFVVDNRPGASGMIAAAAVARAKGDATTLLLGSSAEMAINPFLHKSATYSPSADFQPVAFVGKLPLVLVAPKSASYRDLREVIEAARKAPGEITFASAGVGQVAHLGMELIMQREGVQMLHVPYKGGSDAVNAVLSGQVQLFFSGMPPALPQIAAGNLRPLAVSTRERAEQLSQVPTVSESGVPGFDIFNWFALLAPAGVSQNVIEEIAKATNDAIETPELKSIWTTQGIIVEHMAPTQLGAFIAAESQKYKSLIEASKIKGK